MARSDARSGGLDLRKAFEELSREIGALDARVTGLNPAPS
jgi:hypothetical protein